MNNYGYIYKTTNLIENKIYIGQKKGFFHSNYYGSGIYLKSAIKKTNIKIGPEDNFFTHAKSDGYQGYHVDLEFPNGQHSEVQFNTPQSYAAVLATHPAHEEFGGQMPPEATQKNESMSKHIMQLPTEQANQLSQQAEQTNMPAIMKGQQAAKGVIQQAQQQDQLKAVIKNALMSAQAARQATALSQGGANG